MKIIIETGPCRNGECGDWFEEDGSLVCRSIDMPIKSQIAVGIHELIEAVKCKEDGVTDEEVTAFDAKFAAERDSGLHPAEAEAGNYPGAPYFWQHQAATAVERAVCKALGLSWEEHERAVEQALLDPRKIV